MQAGHHYRLAGNHHDSFRIDNVMGVRVYSTLGKHYKCHPPPNQMQAKVWPVRKHPSCLGMQFKVPVYKKCVHLCKFVVPGTVVVLVVSLSRRQDGQKHDESEEERARRLTQKRKQRQREKSH